MSTTQLDTRTLLEAVAADLELFQLEKDFQGDLKCEARHRQIRYGGRAVPMDTPCSITARWRYRSCQSNLLVCDSFVNDLDFTRHCVWCDKIRTECITVTEL